MADLEDKKVSQLESGTVTSNSVFLDSGNGVSTQVTSQDIANYVAKVQAYQGAGGLVTLAKTLVGAINEVAGSAGKSNLADMDDVNIDDQTLADGQTLIYDDTNDEWINGDVASDLVDLTDVDVDDQTLTDGQALVYDSQNQKWVNGDVASGASANEALPYDENTSYSYGEYCTNLGYLWRCTSTTGATGTWDATKWVAVMITDEYKRVRIMTKAQFDLLSNDEKDGFIYVSDYSTKIQDIDNVTLNTSDNNKLLGVSVSGSDISVEAVEMTAADIPYSSGVSVADMLTPTAFTITPKANVTLGNVQAFKIGKMRIISLYFTASAGTSSILSVSADSLPQDYIYCSLGMQQGVTHDGYGYLDTNGDFGTNANVIAGKLYTVNFIYVVA